MGKITLYAQSSPPGGHLSIGDNKQVVEAHIVTTCRLGDTFVFKSTLMEPILAAPLPSATTLQAYVGMNAAARRPYDIFHMDLIVIIIMTKGCSYSSLRKRLA